MTLLFTIWLFSALTVVVMLGMAMVRARGGILRGGGHFPASLAEFLIEQFHDVQDRCVSVLAYVAPHVRHASMIVAMYAKRTHDLFITRVFGRREVIRGGGVASFFLKHIAEHKEAGRQGGGR